MRLGYRFLTADSDLVYNKWYKNYHELDKSLEFNDYVKCITNYRQITISEKLRSFHYRFTLSAIITNIQLKWYGMRQDSRCSYCNHSEES